MKRGTQVRDRRMHTRRGMVTSDKDWGEGTTYVIWRGDKRPRRVFRSDLIEVSAIEQLAEVAE